MILIDRTSATPIVDQLTEQLRYQIASGVYKVEAQLPSTRQLGKQLGVSFHTVRKAYQQLERDGLLEARVGSGFTVKERTPLSKGERMERGAVVVQEALHRLIGLGLEEAEVEYLVQEQLNLMEGENERHKIIFAAPYLEMAELCANQLANSLQHHIEPTTLKRMERHLDADFVLTPYPNYQQVAKIVPRADVVGMLPYLSPEPLHHIARLMDRETLGLITRYADAIPHLSQEIRHLTGFDGQMIAASVDAGSEHLETFIKQTNLVVYTPACRRRLIPFLGDTPRHMPITPRLSRESIQEARQTLPS